MGQSFGDPELGTDFDFDWGARPAFETTLEMPNHHRNARPHRSPASGWSESDSGLAGTRLSAGATPWRNFPAGDKK